MKISTEIGSISRIVGEEKAVEFVAKAGFDGWDFSMFAMVNYDWGELKGSITDHPLNKPHYLKYARNLRDIGESMGINCNQSHAPFPVNDRAVLDCLKRAIEATAEAGGEICVVHPDNNSTPQENAEFYQSLLPFAKGCNVKLACENMWNWNNEKKMAAPAACSSPKSFLDHLTAVDDPFFVACLDIGHAEMAGVDTSATEMIISLGNHLKALHIHDNDLHHDSHQIPFSMKIDFADVVNALKEIGYSGYLTLEADRYLQNHTLDNALQGVCDLADSAKRLRNMF